MKMKNNIPTMVLESRCIANIFLLIAAMFLAGCVSTGSKDNAQRLFPDSAFTHQIEKAFEDTPQKMPESCRIQLKALRDAQKNYTRNIFLPLGKDVVLPPYSFYEESQQQLIAALNDKTLLPEQRKLLESFAIVMLHDYHLAKICHLYRGYGEAVADGKRTSLVNAHRALYQELSAFVKFHQWYQQQSDLPVDVAADELSRSVQAWLELWTNRTVFIQDIMRNVRVTESSAIPDEMTKPGYQPRRDAVANRLAFPKEDQRQLPSVPIIWVHEHFYLKDADTKVALLMPAVPPSTHLQINGKEVEKIGEKPCCVPLKDFLVSPSRLIVISIGMKREDVGKWIFPPYLVAVE